jgi:pimeloyl-ACP methyl ester carboxylesterase
MHRLADVPMCRVVTTAAGRDVGIYEYGDPDGRPVFALHGTPASGAGFAWANDAALEHNVYLVAPDRPGIGYSTRVQLSSVADYAPELTATADALGFDSFSLLGYSGGAPYALATACAVPQRVDVVAVVAGAGEVGAWASMRDFSPTDRRMTWLAQRHRAIARTALHVANRTARVAPRLAARSASAELSPTDREVMAQFSSPQAALALFTQAFLCGPDGVIDDYVLTALPWGFRVEDVTAPVHIWHGTDDPLVPLAHGEALAQRVPASQLRTWPGEGHLAIIPHIGDVLADLANRAM